MPRFCTRCGISNDDEARFCKGCGATLSWPSTGTASASPVSEQARSGVAPRRDGGSSTRATVRGQRVAPHAVRHAPSDPGQEARSDAVNPGPDAQREQAPLAEIAARIKARDKARAAALAAARLPAATNVKRPARASLLSPPIREKERDSQAHAANGVGAKEANLPPPQDVRARTPMRRTRMMLPVAGLTALVVAGGAYWWMHMRQTPVMHEAAYAPAVVKAPPAPAPPESPSEGLAAVAAAPQSAPRVPALTPSSAQQSGFTATAEGAKQVAQRGSALRARPRQKPVAPQRRRDAQPTPEAQDQGLAGVRRQQRQAEGSVQQAKSQKTAPQISQPAQGLQGRVEALREALSGCQSKSNFFSRELCIQRVRWKYCGAPLAPDPLWGKTPECPNSQQHRISP